MVLARITSPLNQLSRQVFVLESSQIAAGQPNSRQRGHALRQQILGHVMCMRSCRSQDQDTTAMGLTSPATLRPLRCVKFMHPGMSNLMCKHTSASVCTPKMCTVHTVVPPSASGIEVLTGLVKSFHRYHHHHHYHHSVVSSPHGHYCARQNAASAYTQHPVALRRPRPLPRPAPGCPAHSRTTSSAHNTTDLA
jgi:hypothetical protein